MKKKLWKNKRGDASDYILFVIIVFFLAISFLVALLGNAQINDAIKTTQLNESSAASKITGQLDRMESTVDTAFLMILTFLIIGIMVSSFLVRVHPAFLFLYIIFLMVAIILAVFLANTYSDLTEIQAFATISSTQEMTNYIMTHLVQVVIAVGAMGMIIIFSKSFAQRGGGGGITSDIG